MPTSKQLIKGKSSSRRQIQSKQSKIKSSHNIVVVRGANNGQNTEKDPDVVRLQGTTY